jgi:hypothetical protein
MWQILSLDTSWRKIQVPFISFADIDKEKNILWWYVGT